MRKDKELEELKEILYNVEKKLRIAEENKAKIFSMYITQVSDLTKEKEELIEKYNDLNKSKFYFQTLYKNSFEINKELQLENKKLEEDNEMLEEQLAMTKCRNDLVKDTELKKKNDYIKELEEENEKLKEAKLEKEKDYATIFECLSNLVDTLKKLRIYYKLKEDK